MVLDGVWPGLLMKNFHRDQLAAIVRLADGGIASNRPLPQRPFALTLVDAAWGALATAATSMAVWIVGR